MTRLILIRHGESEGNVRKIGSGQSDVVLTERGYLQAELAAKYLLLKEKIDAIYSSDLQRAYNTVLPVAKALRMDITKYSDLREMDIGKWVGLTAEERTAKYPAEAQIFNENFSLLRFPDGEYVPDVYDRVVNCISDIAKKNDGKTVLVATHAGAIRVFHAHAIGLSRLETGKTKGCENTSINIYGYEDGKFFPIETNITAHLEGMLIKTREDEKI